jgi:hypothetical protein
MGRDGVRSINPEQRVPLILLYDTPYWDSPGERWTPAMLDAIRENYKSGPRIAETKIYRPK